MKTPEPGAPSHPRTPARLARRAHLICPWQAPRALRLPLRCAALPAGSAPLREPRRRPGGRNSSPGAARPPPYKAAAAAGGGAWGHAAGCLEEAPRAFSPCSRELARSGDPSDRSGLSRCGRGAQGVLDTCPSRDTEWGCRGKPTPLTLFLVDAQQLMRYGDRGAHSRGVRVGSDPRHQGSVLFPPRPDLHKPLRPRACRLPLPSDPGLRRASSSSPQHTSSGASPGGRWALPNPPAWRSQGGSCSPALTCPLVPRCLSHQAKSPTPEVKLDFFAGLGGLAKRLAGS